MNTMLGGLLGGLDEHALHGPAATASDPQVVVHERLPRVLLVAEPARQRRLVFCLWLHQRGAPTPRGLRPAGARPRAPPAGRPPSRISRRSGTRTPPRGRARPSPRPG